MPRRTCGTGALALRRCAFYKTAMLGFSVTKLLVLAAVLVAVWYGFKMVGRLDAARKAEAKLREREKRDGRGGGEAGQPAARETRPQDPDAEEMVQCPACRAYVPAKNARNCGRPDCPY